MEDQIYITIAKVLHGEASDAERMELDTWLLAALVWWTPTRCQSSRRSRGCIIRPASP
jgi:hypothetical protein